MMDFNFNNLNNNNNAIVVNPTTSNGSHSIDEANNNGNFDVSMSVAGGNLAHLKTNMSLTLAPGEAMKRKRIQFGYPNSGHTWTPGTVLLNSPDVKMLKFNTPEIEKFLASESMNLSTPTPSMFGTAFSSGLTPYGITSKLPDQNATVEQEEYVNGFEIALRRMKENDDLKQEQQKQQQQQVQPESFVPSFSAASSIPVVPITVSQLNEQFNPRTHDSYLAESNSNLSYTSMESKVDQISTSTASMALSGSPPLFIENRPSKLTFPSSSNMSSNFLSGGGAVAFQPPEYDASRLHIKIEQDAESTSGTNTFNTPPLSPIDLASQELQKLERKRLRNRIAATKCRKNKLEKISTLEDQVKVLKHENRSLTVNINQQRDHIEKLKQIINQHVGSGCQMGQLDLTGL